MNPIFSILCKHTFQRIYSKLLPFIILEINPVFSFSVLDLDFDNTCLPYICLNCNWFNLSSSDFDDQRILLCTGHIFFIVLDEPLIL